MSIEPIGMLTIIAGFICMQNGYRSIFATFVVTAVFGSAAAMLIGSANIQPAHLLLGFVVATVFARHHERAAAFNALAFMKPGFWLLCLVIYGICTAMVAPVLMQGITQIVPLGTSSYFNGAVIPLSPVSSNFTQSVYLIADLICFAVTVSVASTLSGFLTIARALLAFAAFNVLLAVIDVITFATGTQWLLGFIRNAQYTLHNEEEIVGLKRIVGSFPEASAFARATLGALGFTGTLLLCGRQSLWTGILAFASLALVVLSTSSTGLAGTGPMLVVLYVTILVRSGFDPLRLPLGSAFLLCTPLLFVGMVLAVLLNEQASQIIGNYFDLLIFNKAGSTSGMERSSWNTIALQNFFDTYGIGVGLGTARTSSFPIALLSNVGVPGTLFYLLFAATTFLSRRGIPRSYHSDVRLAARNGCIGLIMGDVFAAPNVEQGLLFYVLAGISAATPERTPVASPAEVIASRAAA